MMDYNEVKIYRFDYNKSVALSVRCVKNQIH